MSRYCTTSLTVAVSLTLAAGAACSSGGKGSSPAPAGTERILRVEQPIPDRYLVLLADAAGPADTAAASVAADHGATVLGVYKHALRGFSMRSSLGAAGAVALDPRVARVEQDGVARAAAVAWQYGPTWGLDRVDQHGAILDGRYGLDDQWTGQGVDAYVLDTGGPHGPPRLRRARVLRV